MTMRYNNGDQTQILLKSYTTQKANHKRLHQQEKTLKIENI